MNDIICPNCKKVFKVDEAGFEGPKNKTIDYGTWLSESVEINANYGDEPIVEWDGSSLKQVK